METIKEHEVETIDGVEYKLYINDFGPTVRVFDVVVKEVVTIVQYPNFDKAQAAYDTAVETARKLS